MKVIHSARQDIEVLNYAFEISVVNVFDTQIAYNSIYGGQTIGYTSLVEKLFKINFQKNIKFLIGLRDLYHPSKLIMQLTMCIICLKFM